MPAQEHSDFPNLYVIDHPLMAHKMALLRDKQTTNKSFKELVHEITLLLGYEATRQIPTESAHIQTPVAPCEVNVMERQPVIMPILRAGIGMVDALQSLMPASKVGHIGLFRNEETLKPEHYYFKIPKDSATRHFYVVDPMLATGGSAAAAVTNLKVKGVTNITFLCVLTVPEGIKRFHDEHPDVPVYAAAIDSHLNDKAYIVPGLGDAGDRLFGTI